MAFTGKQLQTTLSAEGVLTPEFRRWWAHGSAELGADLRQRGQGRIGSCYYRPVRSRGAGPSVGAVSAARR